MEQESAIELRDRWLERLRTQRTHAMETATEPREAEGPPRIAVGVTGQDGNYRPAIRLQDASTATLQMAEAMWEEAKGEVDVREIGEVRGLSAPVRPLVAGISVGNRFGEAGTLGCLVRKRGMAGPCFILSNNHVLARLNFAQPHEVIEQPASSDQTAGGPFEVAEFGETVALSPIGNFVDAAIAPLLPGIACDSRALAGIATQITGQRVTTLREHEAVLKVGRTTHRTTGTIKAWGIGVLSVQLGSKLFDFEDQIEILPDVAPFCAEGDSGAIVVDSDNLVLGLLFSKSLSTEMAYANPIGRVFGALGIELA